MRAIHQATVCRRVCGWQRLQVFGVVCVLALGVAGYAQGQPVVGMGLAPAVVSEADAGASVTLTFTVEGDIPPPEFDIVGTLISGGLPILFDGRDMNAILDEISGDPIMDGLVLGAFSAPDRPHVLAFVLLQPTSSITFNILDDVVQEADQSYTFDILTSDACAIDSTYSVNPAASSATLTLIDGQGGPGIGPTVGLTVDRTELNEGDQFTVSFTVDGEMPADGLTVLVASPTPRVLGEFAIFNEDGTPAIELRGIAGFPTVGDDRASSFLVTLIEPQATMTLRLFDDGPNEGTETLPFDLVDGEVYEVDPNANSATLTIMDASQAVGPTVGITLDRSDVIEGEPVALTFTVTGEMPAEGLTVLVNDTASVQNQVSSLTEFDLTGIAYTGLAEPPRVAEGGSGFFATLIAPTATITLPVLNDGVDEDEALESFTFELTGGETYEVDPGASRVTLHIHDVPVCQPTVPASGAMRDVARAVRQWFGGTSALSPPN